MTTNKDLRRRETDKLGEWIQQAALDQANARIAELEHALCLIYEWEAPLVDDNGVKRSYSYMYGSNGERDYFRDLAFNSLQMPPPAAKDGE
jgi:hypothetical protein